MQKTIISIVLIGGAIFLVGKIMTTPPEASRPGAAPRIEISPSEYDLGQVSMAQGKITRVYQVKNVGEGPLKLSAIWTSCACTTAALKIDQKTSPLFGMPGHGVNPAFWSETLAPGQAGELEVVFDPAFHGPTGLGEIVRVVYLESNDKARPRSEAKFFGEVIP
jgi:hypothetical protein